MTCEDQYERSDPRYAECKRKAGQVESVDGKEVFIETEPVKKSTFDQVLDQVFTEETIKKKGGEFEIDFNYDFDSKNVDTSGGIASDVFSFIKEGVNAFSAKSKYSQDSEEKVTKAGGIFKQDREEGFKTLQGLMEGVPGLEVKKEKGKKAKYSTYAPGVKIEDESIFLSYTNDKGEVVKSDKLYFGPKATEGIEGSSEIIKKQKDIIKNFFDQNLEDVDLTEFKKIQKKRATEQIKAAVNFMDSELVENIGKKYQNEDLFTEKQGKTIYSMGQKIGNEPSYMPYKKEIEVEIAKINNYLAENNINDSSNTPEKIRKDAENRVRNNLTLKEVNEEKSLFYADEINNSLEDQISNTVGAFALKAVTKEKIVKNEAEKAILKKDQILNRDALEYQSDVLNGIREKDPLLEAKYKVTLKLLGIKPEAEGFESGMSMDQFLKAGSPTDLEDITLKSGVQTTRSALTVQKKLFDQYKARENNYNDLITQGDDLLDTVDDADFVNNLSVKNYDEMQASLRTIGTGFQSMFKEVGYLSGKLLIAGSQYDNVNGSKGMFETNNADRFLDAMSMKYDKEASLLTERYLNPVKFENAFKDPLTFGKFMMQEISSQIPIYVTMAATGNIAPIVIGMSSAGGKLSDMKTDIAMGEANYSSTDMFFKPFVYGLAEAALGTVPSVGIINKNKNRFLKGLKNKGSSDLLSQGTKSFVKENYANAFIWEPLTEYATESLTTGFQNLVDGKPFTENMDHAGFSGFSMSLLMSGSSMAVSTYQSRFSSFDQRNSIRKKQQDLASLGQQYKRSSIKDPNSKQTELLKQEIEKANVSLNSAIEQSNEVVNNNLRAGHAEGVNQILATQTQMQTDAQTILNSTTLTDTEKQLKIDSLQDRYKLFESIKQSSLSKQNMMKYRPEFKLMQANDSDRYNNLLLEAEKSIESDKVTPEAIKRVAYEMYLKEDVVANNDQASKIKDFKLIQHNTIDDAVDAIEKSDLSDDDKSMAINNVRKGADGWADASGAANVVIDNQVENQRKHVATHEIGHLAFWKIFENNEAAFTPIANQLLSSVKDVNPKLYDEFINDVEKDSDGNLISQEVIMRFLEFAADGKMDPKKNALQGFFGTILQKAFAKDYNFDFKGESDITSFVTELGKKIKDGTLSKADIQAASKNASIVVGQGPVDVDKSDVAFSKGDGFANANIASELNLTNSTQNIVEKNNKVFNDVVELSKLTENKDVALKDLVTQKMKNDLVTNNMPRVTALAKQAAKAGQNINLEEGLRKTFDDFNGEYALKLTELANSWNPAKNDSFGAYMNQLLPLKYSGILAKLKKGESDKTTRIDESTTQIADVSTGSSLDTVVEPKIDPLTFLPEGKKKDKFVKSLNNALKNATPEQLKNVSFANPITSDKLLNEFADMFNLLTTGRDGKVKNPLIVKSFNFSDVNNLKNIQRNIIKNYQNLRNSMPKGNETIFTRQGRQGPVKEGGGSLALTTNFLNAYYTRLPKKISNNVQYRLKPLIKNDWLAPLGIVDGLVDPDYTPRKGEAQTLKGMFDAIYKNVASQAADAQLKVDQQLDTDAKARAKANVRSGKSDLVFSAAPNTTIGQAERLITNKDTRFNYTSNIGEFIDTVVATNKVAEAFDKVYSKYNIPIKAKDALVQAWKNVNIQARLKEVEMDLGNPLKINQQKYLYEAFAESQSQVIRDVLGISKDGLNYSDINQMEGMNNTLMEVVNSYRENGKSEAEIYETMYTMASTFTGSSKIGNGTLAWNKQKNGDWKLIKNKKVKGDQRYDLYTNAGEMMKVLGLKKPKGFKPETKVGQSKDAYIRNLRKNDSNLDDKILNKSADYAKKNKDAFFDLLDWYKSLPIKQKAMHKNGMGMILASSYRGTNTLIRESAPVNSIAETDFSEDFGQYRYEHNPPASVMAIHSAEYLTDNKTKKQLQAEFDNFGVTIIPLSMDAVLDENYQSTIPLGNYGRFGRYYNPKNFGKFPFVTKLYSKKNNKWDTRTYGDLAPAAFAIREAEQKTKNVLRNGKKGFALSAAPNLDVLNSDINQMIQDTKGIDAVKKFSDIVAKRRGASVRNFRLISAGAQDFNGLMYDLYGKGKLGEKQQKWVKDNLTKPYQKGIAEIDQYRQALKTDYGSLLKKFPNVAKKLGKTVPGTDFTYDQAIRVNLWTRGGFEIPGISKRDAKKLNDAVNNDPELNLFNDSALLISKQDKWVEPSAHWDVESLISDLNNLTNKVGRKQFLAEFIQNADIIFSKENLNKMEVALGTNWREAMEDSLYRMKNGTNRPSGSNRLTNQFNNWVNNSIGAIMFFNRKSALLQTISSVNFLNWSDNNPFKAALAFGNQPQYWSDFATLWNSPKLKQRRSGLRKDVNEAEIANAAKGSKNKAQAVLSYLLKIGFTPTQLADSFAIASGGATFYRNRLNTYKKQGMSEADAQKKAFEDFSETSDVSQQSADPMLISQQQASTLGRLLLAFQNTPAQVTRIFNKSARDFINGRGDQKTNVSKMIYYGAIQGMIFATLQNALFATIPGFDDEGDEEKKAKNLDKKQERILNSMVDTMLRGSGVYGAIVATLKNTIMTYFKEEGKDAFGKDHRNTLLEALNLSPPVGSKLRKINNAIKAKDYNEEVIKEQGWNVTLKGKVNLSPSYQVIASLTEALTNLPLERAIVEVDAIVETLDARNTTFQRIALALGYRTWDVGTKNEERDLVKIEAKERKEVARKQKVIDDRAERERIKEAKKFEGKTEDEVKMIKRKDVVFDQTRSEQIKALLDLGLTKKEIKALKYEDDRVNKIIELQDK